MTRQQHSSNKASQTSPCISLTKEINYNTHAKLTSYDISQGRDDDSTDVSPDEYLASPREIASQSNSSASSQQTPFHNYLKALDDHHHLHHHHHIHHTIKEYQQGLLNNVSSNSQQGTGLQVVNDRVSKLGGFSSFRSSKSSRSTLCYPSVISPTQHNLAGEIFAIPHPPVSHPIESYPISEKTLKFNNADESVTIKSAELDLCETADSNLLSSHLGHNQRSNPDSLLLHDSSTYRENYVTNSNSFPSDPLIRHA